MRNEMKSRQFLSGKKIDGIYLKIRHIVSKPKNKKKIRLGALILIILYLILMPFFILRNPKQTDASPGWWNSSWLYKKPITISYSGSALTDYQVKITADTAS